MSSLQRRSGVIHSGSLLAECFFSLCRDRWHRWLKHLCCVCCWASSCWFWWWVCSKLSRVLWSECFLSATTSRYRDEESQSQSAVRSPPHWWSRRSTPHHSWGWKHTFIFKCQYTSLLGSTLTLCHHNDCRRSFQYQDAFISWKHDQQCKHFNPSASIFKTPGQ